MGPIRSEWWREDCPARGAALSHAHWTDCPDGHPASMCCHCEQHAPTQETTLTPPKTTCPPHIFWLGKCTQCGQPPDLAAKADARDDVLVERKAIRPDYQGGPVGPQGPLRGQEKRHPPAYGRLPFTQEDYARLMFFCTIVRDPTPEAPAEVESDAG